MATHVAPPVEATAVEAAAGAGVPGGFGEWARGWPAVVVAMLGFTSAALHMFSMGAMTAPIEKELGWTRAEIMSGLPLMSFSCLLLSPLVGMAIDRFGVRAVAVPGILFYGVAMALLSTTGPNIVNWWLLWGLVALAIPMVMASVWASAVTWRFRKHRGLALSIVFLGGALGQAVWPPAATWLTGLVGWRLGFVLMAIPTALFIAPLIWLALTSPGVEGAKLLAQPTGQATLSKWRLFRTLRFLQLAIAAFLATLCFTGLTVNFVPILMSNGLDRGAAAGVASIIGISAIIGRISTGMILDRVHGPLVGGIAFLLVAAAMLGLVLAPAGSAGIYAVCAAMMGLGAGAEFDVKGYLTARYFHLSHYGTVFSVISGLLYFGAGMGAILGGFIFDFTGSYIAYLGFAAACMLIAAVSIFTMGRYPTEEELLAF